MVGVAQLVRAPDCGSEDRGFESLHPPHFLFLPDSPVGVNIGMSPSGKAPDFDSGIRRFESCHPSHDPLAQLAEQLPFKQWVWSSNLQRVTIKSKRYRCHWRKASGINRFRAFSARKFTDDSIDANRCFPLTGGIRTPSSRRLATPETM